MLWKVYNIETGKILKAGFESQDDANDWLEERAEKLADEHVVEEMDADEIEEWNEENGEDEDEVAAAAEDEDEDDYVEDSDADDGDETSLDELYDDEEDDDDI